MHVAKPPFINTTQALSVQSLYCMLISTQRAKNASLGAVTTAVRNNTSEFLLTRSTFSLLQLDIWTIQEQKTEDYSPELR